MIFSLCSFARCRTYSMEIRIGIFRHIVIEDDVHTFNIHSTSEEIRSDENTCLKFFEFFVTCQTRKTKSRKQDQCQRTNRSSCAIPRWISTAGKFCSVNNRHNALQRWTFFTKITTWLNSNLSNKSINLRFFSFSRNLT